MKTSVIHFLPLYEGNKTKCGKNFTINVNGITTLKITTDYNEVTCNDCICILKLKQ